LGELAFPGKGRYFCPVLGEKGEGASSSLSWTRRGKKEKEGDARALLALRRKKEAFSISANKGGENVLLSRTSSGASRRGECDPTAVKAFVPSEKEKSISSSLCQRGKARLQVNLETQKEGGGGYHIVRKGRRIQYPYAEKKGGGRRSPCAQKPSLGAQVYYGRQEEDGVK